MLCSFVGSFIGIALLGLLDMVSPVRSWIGSMGACAVLIFGAPDASLAQPRNVLLGNVVGAVVGVSCGLIFPSRLLWLSGATAVSVTIVAGHCIKVLHPPAGATALIAAAICCDSPCPDGYMFVVMPTLGGYAIMVFIAFIVDNLFSGVKYPLYWW